MRILFLTTPIEDYLQDSLLYGLRKRLGANLIDSPRKDVMYAASHRPKVELYGRGFTMWRHLDECTVDRPGLLNRILSHRTYDWLLFGRIQQQLPLYRAISSANSLRRNRTHIAFLDGEDAEDLFEPAVDRGLYFKRERLADNAANTLPISFGIPEKLIVSKVPDTKTRLFASHVQCPVAYELEWVREHCQTAYAYDGESDMHADYRRSYFGITTKKAGWDCMRHYEIAANGAVPCFYKLRDKDDTCAPFDLEDGINCIGFDNATELREKTEKLISTGKYREVSEASLQWARRHSCEATADRLLASLSSQ